MKLIDFNVNSYVHVKLTDEGKSELRRQYEDLVSRRPKITHNFILPKENDGWSKFQLHSLMHRFGHLMCMTNPKPPFLEIRFETHG